MTARQIAENRWQAAEEKQTAAFRVWLLAAHMAKDARRVLEAIPTEKEWGAGVGGVPRHMPTAKHIP